MKEIPGYPCGTQDAVLLVTSYHKGELAGRLFHPRLKPPAEVGSVLQLLFMLEECMQICEPVSQEALWWERSEECLAVLRIQILFREHFTWQGRLIWEDQQMEMTFRSVLELLKLLDEILES